MTKYLSPRAFADAPWPLRQRLAAQRGINVPTYERRALAAYRSKMARKWYFIQRAQADRHEDADVARCATCGAWAIGECSVNHGWRV